LPRTAVTAASPAAGAPGFRNGQMEDKKPERFFAGTVFAVDASG
jgi:hypothetical protein